MAWYHKKGTVYALGLLVLLINLVLWGLAAWRVRQAGEEMLVLHYNIDVGADFLAPRKHQFFLPATGLLLGGLNLALAAWLRHQSTLLALILLGVAVLIQLMLLGLSLIHI